MPARKCLLLAAAGAILCLAGAGATALEPDKDEKDRLDACEEQICRQVLDKAPSQGVLACDIGKTWERTKIKEGAASKTLKWGFGNARCNVGLRLDRSAIVAALSAGKFDLKVWPHDVDCVVETSSGVEPVKIRLAPRLQFKNGKVAKVWIKLKEVDGPPTVSTLIWSAAALENFFHSDMVKSVNKFIHEKCEKEYGQKAAKAAKP